MRHCLIKPRRSLSMTSSSSPSSMKWSRSTWDRDGWRMADNVVEIIRVALDVEIPIRCATSAGLAP